MTYKPHNPKTGILYLGKRLIASYIPEKTALEICKKQNGYDDLQAERDSLKAGLQEIVNIEELSFVNLKDAVNIAKRHLKVRT